MATKLLLADDSITIQKVVGIIFSSDEYDLTVVGDGDLALEKARVNAPDVMLVDAIMPGRNGYELCQEVRNDAKLRSMPLLLMTGAFEPFDENRARQCGADDVISKPFESQHLVEKVKALLEIGRQRFAAVPPPVEISLPEKPAPSFQLSESFFSVPLDDSWGEPIPAETGFEPTPDMFGEKLIDNATVNSDSVSEAIEDSSPAVVEIVEAEPGDDPWGVFDLIDLDAPASSPAVTPEPVDTAIAEQETEAVPVYPADLPAAVPEQSYDFSVPFEMPAGFEPVLGEPLTPVAFETVAIVEEDVPVMEPPPTTYSASEQPESGWEPVEEESFTCENDEPSPPEELFAPAMHEPVIPAAEPELYRRAADIEPASVSQYQEETASETTAEAPQETVPLQPAAPTEDQLREMLSQISREVIEKIVWEVVPDLAETLIKEEIRKLRQGIAD